MTTTQNPAQRLLADPTFQAARANRLAAAKVAAVDALDVLKVAMDGINLVDLDPAVAQQVMDAYNAVKSTADQITDLAGVAVRFVRR